MNIKIRAAEQSDLTGILGLYAQLDLDNGRVLSLDEASTLFKKIETYPCYHLFVATIENKVIGTFALLIMDNLGHLGAPSGVIEDVAVDPKYQGSGIGKLMMNFAINYCKEKRCYKLSLSANLKRVKAHQFYESLGFRQHGISFVIDFM